MFATRTIKRTCALLPILLLFSVGFARANEEMHIVVMPKLIGIDYYDAVEDGVQKADSELTDLRVEWIGPSLNLAEKQVELLESALASNPDLIAVAANDSTVIGDFLKRAHDRGVRVMSWDADTDFREFFVNLVNFKAFAEALVDGLVDTTGGAGQIAIITTSFEAPNQQQWIRELKRRLYASFPNLRIMDIRPAGESTEESYRLTQDLIRVYPGLSAIIALGVPNMPGVAKAVEDSGLSGQVAVLGNSTPNTMRPFLKSGTVKAVLSWNAPDHGYLTVYSAYRLLRNEISVDTPFDAGRAGSFIPIADNLNAQVALPILIVTADNVDDFDF